jgi:acetate---CoA ligase (ADP-forming)
MAFDLSALLNPASVAIVGVSENASRIGGRLFKYLLKHGYQGALSLVNPKYKELDGVKCYPSVTDIPVPVDCALIAVPEKFVIPVLNECADNQVKAAVVFSSGFAEMGTEGQEKQNQLKELARTKNMRICGPNCIGLVNFNDHTALSFSQVLELDSLIPGNIGLISQSGALGGSLVNRAVDMHIGLSYFISSGNEADLEVSDFIKYLVLHDENTKVIAALVEGFKDGPKFIEAAELARKHGKPIIMLKTGETEAGKKAAASHTGALVGSDAAIDAAFKQTGVIRVRNYDELLQTAALFSKGRVPKGNRVGILTSSGGGGIIMADYYTKLGLKVPQPSPRTEELASKEIASFGTVANPFDLTGQIFSDPDLFKRCMKLFLDENDFDIVQVNVSMVAGESGVMRGHHILDSARDSRKPVVTWWGAGSLSDPGVQVLNDSEIAVFSSPDRCAAAVKALVDYHCPPADQPDFDIDQADPGAAIPMDSVKSILTAGGNSLSEHQGKELLKLYGIPVTEERVATSPDEAVAQAEGIGFPVVLKIDSPDIIHKSEAQAVRVGVSTPAEVRQCYAEIMAGAQQYDPTAHINGILVQEMISGGTEIMVGMSEDLQFGPTIAFGLGGIFVEVLKDIALRVVPLSPSDAGQMVREIKGYQILEGVRGRNRADIPAIVDVLLKISRLVTDWKDYISEIDINPLVVFDEGCGVKALDALVVLKNSNDS